MRTLFYDTWAYAALANAADPHHGAAADADREAQRLGYAAVTSDYVLDETITLLHVSAGAEVALEVADALLAQVAAETLFLVDVDHRRRDDAFVLFRKLAPDTPRLSFTDCTSFAVMKELGIALAFTSDPHFHRPGAPIRPLFERRPDGLVWAFP